MGAVFDSATSKSSTLVFKSFKSVGTLANLLISSLSTSASKAIKAFLAA